MIKYGKSVSSLLGSDPTQGLLLQVNYSGYPFQFPKTPIEIFNAS